MNPDDLIPTGGMNQQVVEPNWSKFQLDIFDAVANTHDNLAIEAVAGSGKSTTIVAAGSRLPGLSNNLFLAFNKSIVKELSGKLPYNTDCKTLNGLGHGLLMRKLRAQGLKPDLESNRIYDVVKSVLTEDDWEEYGKSLVRVVSLGRSAAIGIGMPITPYAYEALVGDNEVEIEYYRISRACRQAVEIQRRMIDSVGKTFDFDDQLYMPVFWDMTFPKYDTVFVDEAQDLSHIQHLMLEKLAARGARIIAVGDSRQAIYAFRGADGNSMSNLATTFNMTLLPLSISYRCPKAVVQRAQQIVNHIQSHPDAPEGKVEYLTALPEPKDFPVTSMIICRTNAPIMTLALQFLKEKVPCQVRSNFGANTLSFIRSFKVNKTNELRAKLSTWLETEKAEAIARGWHGKANMYQDRYDALIPFCDAFPLVVQVIAALQQLFQTNVGPTLTTIHKGKGLEAHDVYILRPDLLPAPFVKSESGLMQERNLEYVAVTRAKRNLYFLPEEQP